MNYIKIYYKIVDIAKGQNRKKSSGYFEKHHIIPKCLSGNNNKENLVLLTAKEHFICHHLLHKMYPENKSLFLAYHRMCNTKLDKRQKLSAKQYEQLRVFISNFNKGENNPNYKNKQNLSGNRNHRSIKIKIDGKFYDSIIIASKETNIPRTTIQGRLYRHEKNYEIVLDN